MNFDSEAIDLIICNPPFHQQNIVGDQIALSMFKQSFRVLRNGGELWVIGNRHLGYHSRVEKNYLHVVMLLHQTKNLLFGGQLK